MLLSKLNSPIRRRQLICLVQLYVNLTLNFTTIIELMLREVNEIQKNRGKDNRNKDK